MYEYQFVITSYAFYHNNDSVPCVPEVFRYSLVKKRAHLSGVLTFNLANNALEFPGGEKMSFLCNLRISRVSAFLVGLTHRKFDVSLSCP